MRNLDSFRCWRCTLCPCKVRSKFLTNFWNRTILLCIPCISAIKRMQNPTHQNHILQIILIKIYNWACMFINNLVIRWLTDQKESRKSNIYIGSSSSTAAAIYTRLINTLLSHLHCLYADVYISLRNSLVSFFFGVLLTVHLSKILVINQLNARILVL